MTDEEIELEILEKGLNAPRVTSAALDAKIVSENYYRFPGTTVTICLLHLQNGYTVTGESACVSSENFDIALGEKIAREHAKNKLWALEGYLLAERLALR